MQKRLRLTFSALAFSAVYLMTGNCFAVWAISQEDLYHQKAKELFAKSNQVDDSCLAIIDKAIKINPKRGDFYLTKASFLWCLQDDDEMGLACLDKAVELGDKGSYLYFLKSQFLCRLGRKREALAAAEKSFGMNKECNCAHFCSLLLEQLGDYAKARQWVDLAIKLNPGCNDYYNSRAGLRYKTGDYRGAIADADMSLKLSRVSHIQTVRRAWRLKADAYDKLNDGANAEKSLIMLLKVYPNDRVTLQALAKHYRTAGNTLQEKKILEQIRKIDQEL